MFRQLVNKIPEKHRFITFLVITSLIGVGLILISVYNASKELEVIHEIESLHRFASAQLSADYADQSNYQNFLALASDDYQILIVSGEKLLVGSRTGTGVNWHKQKLQLNASRLNDKGGLFITDGRSIVWAELSIENGDKKVIFLHQFSSSGLKYLKQVYLKRSLVPAIFYIWLMVWMAFIIRFLTDKLLLQKQEMQHMALHDSLTDLPNRNFLDERLNKTLDIAKRKQGRFSLAVIDLDGFKKINDTHGHLIGDALLVEIASRLKDCLRTHDTVARVGGDEFVLLLDDMQKESSLDVCDRVAVEILKPVYVHDFQIHVGASIGITSYPEHGREPETLIQKADKAMYAAKAGGGGILLYEENNKQHTN